MHRGVLTGPMSAGALGADDLSAYPNNGLNTPTYLTDSQRATKNGDHIDWLVVLLDGHLKSN